MQVFLTNSVFHISILEPITNQQAIAHLITLNINNSVVNATTITIHILNYNDTNNVTNLLRQPIFR